MRIMEYTQYYQLAAAYGQGAYNTCAYQSDASSCATTGTAANGGTTTNGNTLSNTGVELLAGASVACLLIAVAVATRFGRRKKTSNTPAN